MNKKGIAKEFSPEQEQFVRDNYKTMRNKDLGEKLGVSAQYMKRLFIRLGIKRTPEEIKAVIDLKDKPVIDTMKKLTIEGGGRSNGKARYHKECWIKENGPIRKNSILMYATKDYDNWKDLKLVRKSAVENFIIKRDKAIRLAEERAKSAEKRNRIEIKRAKNQKLEAEREKLLEKIKANPRNIDHEAEMGKVPVRLDSRTLMYVKREKCIEMEDGTFQLKAGVTTKYKAIGEKYE